MRPQHTLPRLGPTDPNLERSAPRQVLIGLWVTLLVLTFVSAGELRERAARDGWFGAQPWAISIAEFAARCASGLGLTRLNTALHALADKLVPEPARPEPTEEDSAGEPHPTREERSGTVASPASRLSPEPGPDTALARERLDLERMQVRRVLLVGASSFQFYLGAELERLFGTQYSGISVMRRAKVSTGLARPDRLDWRREVRLLMREFKPDLVISDFGGNDAQNMLLPDGTLLRFGTAAWDQEYRARVGHLIAIARRGGARIAVLGMPSMRSPSFSRRMQRMNGLIEQATERYGAVFVPTWDLASDENGRYKESITVDGVRGLMRLPDGKHYSRLGAIAVTRRPVQRLEQSFTLLPQDRALSVVVRREHASAVLGKKVSYLAYVPQSVARGTGRLPVLYLLHGADGSFTDWPEHAHRALQQLSNDHGLIVVVPDAGRDGWYIDSPFLAQHRYATWFAQELVPDVDRWLPTNGRRGIVGQSAGGHGALTLALSYPALFASASSMSGVLDLPQARNRPALVRVLGDYAANPDSWHARSAVHMAARKPKIARRLPMLISVGSADRWAPVNRGFARQLTSLGVPHEFVETEGGHDWQYWTSELPRHIAWHEHHLAGR